MQGLKAALLAVLLLAADAGAIFTTQYGPSFVADPADCTAADCNVAADRAKLQGFGYWKYLGTSTGLIALGVRGPYMYWILCNHCTFPEPFTLAHGPHAGKTFDNVPFTDPAGSRQFGRGNINATAPQSHFGDRIFRSTPTDSIMPTDMPLLPVPNSFSEIEDGALALVMGRGTVKAHSTRAWYAECATTVEGGNPAAPSQDACCTAERLAGQYDPAVDGTAIVPLPQNGVGAGKVAYGGDGVIATCDVAGLTKLGPTWQDVGGWSWAVFPWYASSASQVNVGSGTDPDQPRVLSQRVLDGSAEGAGGLGHCVTVGAPTGSFYRPRTAPASASNAHHWCQYDTETDAVQKTASTGDSGGAMFIYVGTQGVDGRWVYSGNGLRTEESWNHSIVDPGEWIEWVLGGKPRAIDVIWRLP